MKFAILTVLALLISVPSFASGKNLVLCGWNDNDDSLAIRQDAGGQLVALFSTVDHGTVSFKVEKEQGGYEGQGFSLHLDAERGESRGVAQIRSLGVRGEGFSCRIAD